MTTSYRTPPVWNEDRSFEAWKSEIDVWKLVTDLPPGKRAPAVLLSLPHQKKEVALELTTAELSGEDGLDLLIDKLKASFGKEGNDRAIELYSRFENLTRGNSLMSDYIQKFQTAYHQITNFDMKLPTAVLACKLLNGANLDDKERKMVLAATSELEYDKMKASLRRIFNTVATDLPQKTTDVKEEPTFMTHPEDVETSALVTRRKANYKHQSGNWRKPLKQKTTDRETNPLDSSGRPSRCAVCGSIFHWARDCTEKEEKNELHSDAKRPKPDDDQDVFLTIACDLTFLKTCFSKAIVDTACTKTVASYRWVNDYVDRLDQNLRKLIKKEKSDIQIVFGDNGVVQSHFTVTLPVQFGELRCFLKIEVIDGFLPLLLSLRTIENAGFIFDARRRVIKVRESTIPYETAASGHALVPLLPNIDTLNTVLLTKNRHIEPADVGKLHAQFGHCKANRLRKLLDDAGFELASSVDIDAIVRDCVVCARYGRVHNKPVVTLPLSSKFNEVVAMDLHQLSSNCYYLHIIDTFTRLSAATLIFDKKPRTIVNGLMTKWCWVYGTPQCFLTDNGGEFSNKTMEDLCLGFNIRLRNTAAESLFSNGICERHNATLTETYLKMRESSSLPPEMALQCSVFAKNCLVSKGGFSPFQLIFGTNPIVLDENRETNAVCEDSYMKELVQAVHLARRAFTAAECTERVNRALRTNTRGNRLEFVIGDRVLFKRNSSDHLRGPGTVIGIEGAVYRVEINSHIFRVHNTHLRRPGALELGYPSLTSDRPAVADSLESEEVSSTDPIRQEPDHSSEYPSLTSESPVAAGFPKSNEVSSTKPIREEPDHCVDETPAKCVPEVPADEERKKIAKNDLVSFTLNERNDGWDDTNFTGRILGRAGKANGMNKMCYNLIYEQPEEINGQTACVDFDRDVKSWRVVSESSDEDICLVAADYSEAKKRQLVEFKFFNVFEEVPDDGQKAVSARWVLTEKRDGTKKARLVARGFQDPELSSLVKDSPTCSRESLRVLLAINSSQSDWKCGALDVKSAFLQGLPLRRTVFLRPPKDVSEKNLWKLNKCVYGLADASREWYNCVVDTMKKLQCVTSEFDPCIFVARANGTLIGFIAIHVDDFFGPEMWNLYLDPLKH